MITEWILGTLIGVALVECMGMAGFILCIVIFISVMNHESRKY